MSRFNLLPPAFLLLGFVTGCQTTNTLPRSTSASDPVTSTVLYIPEDFEIRSVDFNATMYGDQTQGTTSSTGGRAFVKVYAAHRRTGEQYLLLYENIEKRPRPIMVVRFEERPASEVTR